MRNAGLDETQTGIKIAGRNINNLRHADDTTLKVRKRRTKEPLEESKRGEWKTGLKFNIQETKITASGPITSWEIDGDKVTHYTLGPRIPADDDCSCEIKRLLLLWKSFDQPRQHIIKKRHYFTNKAPSSQSSGFSSSHVWLWELDYKESWAPENWCFWTLVLKKNFESPLDCKEIQQVHPKGNQFWIFGGRTDGEAETPIIWPPDVKSCLIWEDPDAGKDWRWEEKGSTEDETVGWHHKLNGHEFE